MASNSNVVVLSGCITADAQTINNKGIKFSIANNYVTKENDQYVEKVSFYNCIAWGERYIKISQYLKKGKRINLQGKLRQNKYTDKDGNNRQDVQILLDNIELISNEKHQGQNQNNTDFQDDIPF